MCAEQGTFESVIPSDTVHYPFKISLKVEFSVLSPIEVPGLELRTGVPHSPQRNGCNEAAEVPATTSWDWSRRLACFVQLRAVCERRSGHNACRAMLTSAQPWISWQAKNTCVQAATTRTSCCTEERMCGKASVKS